MAPNLGFLFGYHVAGDGFAVLEVIDPGSAAFGIPFVDVKTFGAKGDGVTDDSAAIQAAFNHVAGTGVALWFSPGSYLHDTTVNISSDTIVWGSPDAILLANISGAYPLAGSLWRCGITGAATVTTTLAGNVTPGSNQVSVTTGVGMNVGDFIRLESTVGNTGNRQSYQIKAKTGATPATLTLDRAVIAKPFVTGDRVKCFAPSQVPQNIKIYGNCMKVRGKAVVTISLQNAWYSYVENLIFDAASNTSPSDACFGFNDACYDGYAFKLYGDMFGGGAPSVIFAPESSEACVFDSCVMKNGANLGGEFVNSFACLFVNSIFEKNLDGLAWTNDIVSTNGSDYCEAIGCQAIGNTNHGFDIGDLSTDAVVADCEALYNGGAGFVVEAGTLRASISGKAVGNATGALIVNPGAKATVVPYLNLSENGNTNLNIQDDCAIGALVGDCPGTAGITGVLLVAGEMTIGEIDFTHRAGTTATFVVQVNAGRLTLNSGRVKGEQTGDVCLTTNGGVLLTGAVECNGSGVGGTFGVYAPAGVVRMQDGFNASTCATPFLATLPGVTNRGTVTLNNGGPVVVPFSDLTTTDRILWQLTALGGTGAGGNPVTAKTPGVGFTATQPVAGDISVWDYVIS